MTDTQFNALLAPGRIAGLDLDIEYFFQRWT